MNPTLRDQLARGASIVGLNLSYHTLLETTDENGLRLGSGVGPAQPLPTAVPDEPYFSYVSLD